MKTKNLILGGALAVIGLLMTIMPGTCVKAVVILVGLGAIVLGGYNLFFLAKKSETKELKKSLIVKGAVSVVIGLIAVICPFALLKTAASIWKIFSYVLAVYLILYSVYGFYTASKLKDSLPEEKKRITKESFTSLLIAVLLIVVPIEEVGTTLIRIIGIGGMVIGVLLILVEIVVSKRTTVVEAKDVEVVDDPEAASEDTGAEEKTDSAAAETAEESKEAEKTE